MEVAKLKAMVNNSSSSEKDDHNKKDEEEEEEVMRLPGFRFHPTDEELVGFYLRRKVEKKTTTSIDELIKQIDIYKYDPWDLPKVSSRSSAGDKECYFFCRRGRKYRNSIRPNRVTGSGFWKATGIDKPIYSSSSSLKDHNQPLDVCIGLKKSLVYYRGTAGKGTKTDWMMNEFRLPPINNVAAYGTKPTNFLNAKDITQEAEVWTLCRIVKRIPSYKKYTVPNLIELATSKQNPSFDSSSKTCSLESDQNCSSDPYVSLEDSVVIQGTKRNRAVAEQVDHDETNQCWFVGHDELNNSVALQAPFTAASYSSLIKNPNENDFFTNGSWDELRPVVQLAALDPSQLNL